MLKHTKRIILVLVAATLPACVADGTSSSSRAIIDTPCAVDTDCPTGFECEVEVEHGTTTSYCQAHEDSDGTCPAGYEFEIEHGQAYCKPHGGDDSTGGGADAGTTDEADGCTTDADCPVGLECEIEEEHGETWSFCKPHGE